MREGEVLPLAEVIDGVDRRDGIKLARIKRFNILLFAIVILNDGCFYVVVFEPLLKHLGLHAALIYANPLAAERLGIARADGGVLAGHDDIKLLFTHLELRKEYFLGAIGGVGNVREDVNLAPFELLIQLRPSAAHVLIFPACVGGYSAEILVAEA